jgi:hypothetical protein
MNRHRLFKVAVFVLFLIGCFPRPALAYIGPGTGMSAVGVFLAVLMGFAIALFGFLWYPFKRLMRMCKKRLADKKGESAA